MVENGTCPDDFMGDVEMSTSALRCFCERAARRLSFDDKIPLAFNPDKIKTLRDRVWEVLQENGGVDGFLEEGEVETCLERFGDVLLRAAGVTELFLRFDVRETWNGDGGDRENGGEKSIPISFSVKRRVDSGVKVASDVPRGYRKLSSASIVRQVCSPSDRRIRF